VIELERVACNLCGSTDAKTVYDFGQLSVVRCRNCGLVYTSPRLTQAAIERKLYGPDYWRAYERQYENALPSIQQFSRRWLATLGRLANRRPPWKVFELGPGLGALLAEARGAGHDVYGADISEHATRRAKERFGLEVVNVGADGLDGLDLPPLDVFVMAACIEHLPDPGATLAAAQRRLVPEGLLFLSTGVYGSFNQRIAGKRWGIIDPEAHLYYFSKRTLRRALDRAGFDILLLETNEALVNPLTESPKLVRLFNNRLTAAIRLGPLVRRARLGDEMFVVARKRPAQPSASS